MTSAGVLAALAKAPKTDGTGKSPKKKQGLEEADVVNTLARWVLSHERSINDLVASTSITILLKTNDIQEAVVTASDLWRSQVPKPDTPGGAAGSMDVETGQRQEHPMKASLRFTVHAVIIQKLIEHVQSVKGKTAVPDRLEKALLSLGNLRGDEFDIQVVRLRPVHATPKENRPWAFHLHFGTHVPAGVVEEAWGALLLEWPLIPKPNPVAMVP